MKIKDQGLTKKEKKHLKSFLKKIAKQILKYKELKNDVWEKNNAQEFVVFCRKMFLVYCVRDTSFSKKYYNLLNYSISTFGVFLIFLTVYESRNYIKSDHDTRFLMYGVLDSSMDTVSDIANREFLGEKIDLRKFAQ